MRAIWIMGIPSPLCQNKQTFSSGQTKGQFQIIKMEIEDAFCHFLTPLFSFAIESYINETDFTLGLSKKNQL